MIVMPFPRFAGKHAHDSLTTPHEFLAYMRAEGLLAEGRAPENIIVTFQNSLLNSLREAGRLGSVVPFLSKLSLMSDPSIGVAGGFGIGAPAMALAVEELVALGARRFVIVGTAGALQPLMEVGDAVLCTAAIRDEGVSHHYLVSNEEVFPTAHLVGSLRDALTSRGVPFVEGETWTIDAPYRETVEEATHYRDAGVLTVEMEASALFAVAVYRGVEAAALFVVSDSLAGSTWVPRFGSEKVRATQQALFDVAVDALMGL